jgi:hypothetical protein
MSKGTVNIPITHYDDLKSIIGKWKESHTQAINKIAELEKELEEAMTFNVDVVRCLSRIASVENHNEVPAYIDMSRRCIKAIEAKGFLQSTKPKN